MGCYRLSPDFYARWNSPSREGLDEENLLLALELMRDAGYERLVFYDRESPFAPAEWLSWTQSTDRLFFLLCRPDFVPISAVWFDGYSATGRQAYSHFCTFKTGEYAEFVRGGRQLLAFLRRSTPLRQAIGMTPACYRHALRLAYALGYVRTALLEKAVLVQGKERDAVLTVNNLAELEV